MASPEGSPSRRAGDEWTMVNRVSELMENGGMSDISLPPLPAFEAASEAESRDESDGDDLDDSFDLDEDSSSTSTTEMNALRDDGNSPASPVDDGGSGWSVGGSRGDEGSTSTGMSTSTGGGLVILPRERRRNSATSSRRRAHGRTARSGRVTSDAPTTAVPGEVSSSSVSPARPRRRIAGRTEKSTRRFDEGVPPSPQTVPQDSEMSSDFSSSPCAFPSTSPQICRHHRHTKQRGSAQAERSAGEVRSNNVSRALPSDGGGSQRGERRKRGGEGGNELVPFSLEEIPCIVSETVSGNSSPFRTNAGLPSREPSADDHTSLTGAIASPRQSQQTSSNSGGLRTSFYDALAADRVADGTTSAIIVDGDVMEEIRASSAAGGRLKDGQGEIEDNVAGSASQSPVHGLHGHGVIGVEDSGVRRCTSSRSASRSRSSSMSNTDNDSNDNSHHDRCSTPRSEVSFSSTNYSSSGSLTPATNAFGTANNAYYNRISEADRCCGGGEDEETAAGSVLNAGSGVSNAPESELMASGGAWSLSAKGMTPLGRLFGGGGGIGGGDWGAASSGVGGGYGGGGGGGRATGSLLGFAGYKSAVLEARAEAAEEQGDFWQRRACAAEDAKRRLEKVVAEQAVKITELLERCASQSSSTTASTMHTGAEEYKEAVSQRGGDPDLSSSKQNSSNIDRDVVVETEACGGGDSAARNRRESRVAIPTDSGVPRESKRNGGVRTEDEETKDGWRSAEGCGGGLVAATAGIAFTSFSVGQIGMFFPTPKGNFLAFNVGCPAHFLSKESQELVGRDENFRPYYVLGRIIEIQDVICEENNPFKLAVGQEIKVVAVETVTPDLKAAGLLT